jgi:hypothetical protein
MWRQDYDQTPTTGPVLAFSRRHFGREQAQRHDSQNSHVLMIPQARTYPGTSGSGNTLYNLQRLRYPRGAFNQNWFIWSDVAAG